MSQDQETARLRECLRYIRIVLRNNAKSNWEICETIDRMIGADRASSSFGNGTGSFGGGGASIEGIPQDPTVTGGGHCILPPDHTGPCRTG